MRACFCAAWFALAVSPALAAETYTMDAAHCIPSFEFTHLGMTTQSGRFDRVRGEITLDRAAHRGSVWYEVDTASLNMGFGTEAPDSPGFHLLEVARFPKITFRADNFYFDEADRVIAAHGELTLLGVTRPLTVWLSKFACGARGSRNICAANVRATVKRSEFGMLRFIPAISDEVEVSVPVEAYENKRQ